MSPAKSLYQCDVSFPGSKPGMADLVRLFLQGLGVPASGIAEHVEKRGSRVSFTVDSRAKALAYCGRIRKHCLKGVKVSCASLEKCDWQNKWKRYVKPFALTRRITVVPQWKRSALTRATGKEIYVDTTLAFGTGLHATTRMMAALITSLEGKFSSFLDAGTGTGILSIVAARCGAGTIEAFDISREAVKTAKCNFRANKCRVRKVACSSVEGYPSGKAFDLVAANLLTEDLVDARKKLLGLVRPRGYLAISGISRGNYRSLRARFKARGLRCLRVLEKDGWCALLFRKGDTG